LIRRPRCLDKPDRCAQDLLTLSSIIALMQGHTALVMFDLASLLDEATALISITSSFDRHREVLMRGIVRALATFMLFVLAPSVVYAQATLAGVARDTSGAVLPGVTVEAASPVLIEKVRTATTDETGRYSIPDLRPGDYTVTFALTGFRTIVRSGVALSGTAVVTINADLTVGGVQETITVSGETPVVDLQSTTR